MKENMLGDYWEDILDNVRDGIIVVSPEGRIMLVNEAMENLTGYDRDRLVDCPCTVLKCDACELVMQQGGDKWCTLFVRENVKNRRCLFMRKDGSFVSAIKNASVIKDAAGNPVAAVETFDDISKVDKLDKKIELLSKQLGADTAFHGIVGKSPIMQKVFQIIERAALSDAPVIIYGESGTGKELVAQAIHELGRRREGPFIQFNCAALNQSLLESELFGHVRGAFTGAYRHRMGRFEAAQGGDIFLDEMGDVPLPTQAKLLRVLETKHFERVGDHTPVSVDARVISATNRDLSKLVSEGNFRKDLFFRINVIPIHLPPLRKRREDIPLLVDFFLYRLRKKSARNISGVSPDVMEYFMSAHWPGNVRELKSALEYAFIIADEGLIESRHLPANLALGEAEADKEELRVIAASGTGALNEKAALVEALRLAGGRKTEAAKILGVHRMTVWNRMKKYGIELENLIKA